MIIKELHINGFGIFNDFSLRSLKKGINVFLGNNEMGKSTLLKFIRYTLFGYPKHIKDRMIPLNGGIHGGRIKTELSIGREVLFERFGNNSINLLYDGQDSQNESQWEQILGNASPDLYNNVYSFSLDELVDINNLTESGIEDKIFSIGMGLGNTSINEIDNNIEKEAEKLYKKGGKKEKRIIPSIVTDIKQKKEKLQAIQDNLPRYQELTSEIKELEKETVSLEKELDNLRSENNKMESYLKCYQSFINIIRIDQSLSELPDLKSFPEKGVEKLDKLEEKEQQLNEKLEDITKGTQEQKSIHALEKEIKEISFNHNILDKKDNVVFLNQNIEKYKQNKEDLKEEKQTIKNINVSVKQDIESINGGWTEKDITGFTDLTTHRNKIEILKKELEQLNFDKNEVKVRLDALKENKTPNNYILLSVVVLLFLSVPVFYYGWIVGGFTLISLAIILYIWNKFLKKEAINDQNEKKWEQINNDEIAKRKEYEDYLEQILNLPKSLSPETTLDVFDRIEKLKKEINERDKLINKIEEQRLPFIKKFEEEVASFDGISENTGHSEDNIEILVARIIEEYQDAEKKTQHQNILQQELKKRGKEKEDTESQLKQIQADIDKLLKTLNAKGREEYRKKYDDNNKVKELKEEKETAVRTIEQIAGYNKSAEVIDFLKQHDKEYIESKRNELKKEIQEKEQNDNAKRDELGAKKNEAKRLEGESELSELLTEIETDKQKLKNYYQEWASHHIARQLLSEVKIKYEKEKQPEVIKFSNKYFKNITSSKYKRIRVSLDKKEVAIYDDMDMAKKIEQLSRGTREQLLVSLRLGFIEAYEKKSEPLPIVIDEILVNFDPERAQQTADILKSFGKERQILLFTCHPQTMDFFDQHDCQLFHIKNQGKIEGL